MLSIHLTLSTTGILKPVTDTLYPLLPGGGLFPFLGMLPGANAIIPALLNLPGSGNVLNLLSQLGVLG